jgi:hypothetical protein
MSDLSEKLHSLRMTGNFVGHSGKQNTWQGTFTTKSWHREEHYRSAVVQLPADLAILHAEMVREL